MDSDHPDFNRLLDACAEHSAFLMVDCAHDLGLLGPEGRGVLGEQGVLERVDFLVGSFSKSFACIGGFFATRGKGTAYQVRGFSGSYTFSNYLIPAQVAAVRAALGIISSAEGQRLREASIERCLYLRRALERRGVPSIGRPSAMVIVPIGSEAVARRAYRHCLELGVIVNCIEFPACRRGEARFRLQVTPRHTPRQLESAADIVAQAIHHAKAADKERPNQAKPPLQWPS
jgi:7-keto-8-aminopelargonate synthetase-like enzyme